MSAICLVILKKHNLAFDELNDLANKLVRYCLNCGELAVAFNSFDYAEKLIEQENMKDFFFLSDSFLYKNCEFLEEVPFIDTTDLEKFEKQFKDRYRFFNDIFKVIFGFNVSEITIFMSTDGASDTAEDFMPLTATPDTFLHLLFDSVINNAEKFAYQIHSLKITIENEL